jgi:ABC-2 type transport system permease protein
MIRRLLSIMYKEFLHMFRDPRMLSWLFLIPIVQLFLLAYAADPNVDHLKTAVLDLDRTTRSRDLIATYQASNYFDITHFPDDQETMGQLLDLGQIRAGLIIPAGFGEQLDRKERPQVKFIIDGSDPTVANAAYSSAQTVGQAISMQLTRELVGVNPEEQPGLDVRPLVQPRYAQREFYGAGRGGPHFANALDDDDGHGHCQRTRTRDYGATHCHPYPLL